jgi:hypothetical protein
MSYMKIKNLYIQCDLISHSPFHAFELLQVPVKLGQRLTERDVVFLCTYV